MNATQAELFSRIEIAKAIGPLPRLYCGLAEALEQYPKLRQRIDE